MKKFFVIMVAALMATASINAQSTKILRFGLEGGLNVNKLSLSSDMFSSSNRCGFFVGPKMLIKIPLVGLGADVALLYNNNGASASYSGPDPETGEETTLSNSHNLSYLTIPVNLRYDVSFLKIMGAYVATGPQYSVCMNSEATMNEVLVNRSSWAWNIGAGLKFIDHIHVGFTYSIPLKSNDFSLYSAGSVLSDIVSSSQKTFTVRLAYIF